MPSARQGSHSSASLTPEESLPSHLEAGEEASMHFASCLKWWVVSASAISEIMESLCDLYAFIYLGTEGWNSRSWLIKP
jgi:hypothetical protein